MRIKVITVATSENKHLQALRDSAARNGMDLIVLGLGEPWQGFGTKIIKAYQYLKTLDGYTHFIFLDAYDTLFLKPITYVPDHLLFSTEKHKWPDQNAPYPESNDTWKYLNSGAYMGPISDFIELIDANPVKYEDDDQLYFTNIYLKGSNISLDTACKFFQSYAFIAPGDFKISDKFRNNITGTEPSVIHFNGKCHESKIYRMHTFNRLRDINWVNSIESHKAIHEGFVDRTNDDEELNAHRTFVENHIFGFGERSFPWMWNLIVKEMPAEFTFLEIGVFKGQTLSLIELLAKKHDKLARRYGVTPLSTEGGVWESDYKRDIELIHDAFGLAKDYHIVQGLSEDPTIIKEASNLSLDILYIDGGHEERHITNDIDNYSHLVKPGGLMVIDDCCNSFPMPFGYFTGIQAVTKVIDEKLPPATDNPDWEFLFSVVHNRVYRRK